MILVKAEFSTKNKAIYNIVQERIQALLAEVRELDENSVNRYDLTFTRFK